MIPDETKYYGTYKGFVGDNNDPNNLGRLQVYVPDVYGTNLYKYWAPSKGIPFGKGGLALHSIPAKYSPIWVTFEQGDCRFPIWEYGYHSEPISDSGIDKDVFVTTGGHRVELNNSDSPFISIKDKSGQEVLLNKDGIHLGLSGSSLVNLGKLSEAAEFILLGESTNKWLGKLIDAIKLITVPTAMGPSDPPINAQSFTLLKQQLDTLLSKKVKSE